MAHRAVCLQPIDSESTDSICNWFAAFPVSGMVTIPVSMYQTVVTNLNLQGEGNIPIAMSTISGTTQMETGNDDENQDVKGVLNGQSTIRITANNEENS